MFDLVPRLQTITPQEGAGIFLKRLPDGTRMVKIKRGVDFNTNTYAPADATVAFLLEEMKSMGLPTGWLGLPSIDDLCTTQGIGLLIKRSADGRFAVRVQTPCDMDARDMHPLEQTTITEFLNWLKAVLGR